MDRRKDIALTLGGIAIGLALGAPAAAAALTASPTTQRFYVNGLPYALTAYSIGGNNYVKLRDIGRAVDFGVTYDGSTNSVYIDPDAPYVEEVKDASQTANADIRNEIIRLANQARAKAGVPALTVNTALMDAAQDCSAQMRTTHDAQYENKAALAHGYPYGIGVNLTVFNGVSARDVAAHAVNNWGKSPGHYRTMIDPLCDTAGVGVTVANGFYYCYMVVGNPNSGNPYAP